ncbi:RICIN domain-containing protein [Enterococcus sp. BWT-B8]|uniref:RICIN domain-containing protein n=1 Tax=Enterococcus sp. BWT-B8 TaxID=2885157 RepID=UPI001E40FEF0|nr:RICIN domain-containing protein [Enterococcus sp. BWT-B8]MCB5952326.1 RICIN domain-containing protein [Enterococcus sp. BWT-B8]
MKFSGKLFCLGGASLLLASNLLFPITVFSEEIQNFSIVENSSNSIVDNIDQKSSSHSIEEAAGSGVSEQSATKSSIENSINAQPETASSSTEDSIQVEPADITNFLNKEIKLIPLEKPEKRLASDEEGELILEGISESRQQNFNIEPSADGWFTVQNEATQKYLSIEKRSENEQTIVTYSDTANTNEQKWLFADGENGEYLIQSKSEQYLETSETGTIELAEKTEENSQKWKVEVSEPAATEATAFSAAAPAEIAVANGTYQLQSSGLGMYLSIGDLNKSLKKQLIISSEMYSKSSEFKITKSSDGWYTITNAYSSLVLDVAGASKKAQAVVQQYSGNQSDAQKFKFLDAGNGDVFIKSKLGTVIERTAGRQAEGTLIQTYTLNYSAAQKWKVAAKVTPNEVSVANGVYNLSSAGLNKNMTLATNSTGNGVGLIINHVDFDNKQQFNVIKESDGWYTITNEYSKKVLDVNAANSGNKAKVQQYASNKSDAQKFKFINAGSGNVYILSKLGTVLERSGGGTENRTPIQTYRLNKTAAQKWKLTAPLEVSLINIENGEYQIKGAGTSKVFSIGELNRSNSKTVQLRDSTYGKIDAFIFTKQSDGWYQIKNKFSGKVLDIQNGSDKNGTNIQQYTSNNSEAQKFRFIDAGDGCVYIKSKLGPVLERPGASVSEGLVIKTYVWNKTAAQKWKIEKQGTPNVVKPTSGNRYFIEAGTSSNSVLDVSAGSTANGAKVQLWTENKVNQQKFIPQDLGNGWYKLENVKSKKVLDISGGSSDAKVSVQQYSWNSSDAQQFRFINAGSGYVYIQSKLGSYLDIIGGSTKDGTKLQTYSLNKTTAQKFKLQNISSANALRTTVLSKDKARVTVFNPNSGKADGVKFPTWSRENGQDDIKWLNGTKNSDGSWSVTVNSADFKHAGHFDTHVYVKSGGTDVYVGKTSYKLEKVRTEQDNINDRLAKPPYYYSQLDSRWSRLTFGTSKFGPSGCVPTSMAMVLKGSYGMNVTPVDTANRVFSYGGFNQQYFGSSGTDLVRGMRAYGRTITNINSLSELNDYLSKGYPVIMLVDVGIGHAIVTHGYSNGKTNVYDPYGRQFYNGWVSTSQLWNTPSKDSIDWSAGRPYFVIK